MASLSITTLMKFFENEHKSISRGENYYRSGHIMTCTYSDGVIAGKVSASMKNKEYPVQVHLNDNMDITSTTCDCPRGTYKCSHAAALFIHAIHNISRTDAECQWKRKKCKNEVVKSAEELYPPKRKYQALSREVTREDKEWFCQQLEERGQFTGLCWLMKPEPVHPTVDPDLPLLEAILNSSDFKEASNKELYFLQQMAMEWRNIVLLAEKTKGQRTNDAWHLVRKGRLTASNFGRVLRAKKITPSLLKKTLGEESLEGVKSVMWGNDHEAEAIKAFSNEMKTVVEDRGVWLDESGLLGASPDGLVGQDFCLEMKGGEPVLKQSHRTGTKCRVRYT